MLIIHLFKTTSSILLLHSQTLTDKRKCTSDDLGLHPFAGN
jgi:hypothetical protein